MNLIVAFLTFAFNAVGMFLLVSNSETIAAAVDGVNTRAKIYSFLWILVSVISIAYGGMYFIVWMVLEYMAILCWYGRHKKDHLENVIRGILALVVMSMTELSIILLYYHNDIVNLKYSGKVDFETQIACSVGTALIQQPAIVFRYIRQTRKGSRKVLMYILAVKEIADIVWFYTCAAMSFLNQSCITSGLFAVEIVFNYTFFFILAFRIEERTEQDIRAQINSNAYEYYLNMEEEHLQIRKMYHEMKNQLMIMENGGEDQNGRKSDYSHTAQKKLEDLNHFYHTGQPSLDMLLFDGEMKAKARNIEFDAVVSEGCLDFMNKEDINMIFGNAIINAIEACEKIKEGPRQIRIKAGKNLNDTLVYVKNTVSHEREKGSLSTKKKNRIEHGIGLTSIQECAEKYGGYVSIIEEEGTFQLAILFGKE